MMFLSLKLLTNIVIITLACLHDANRIFGEMKFYRFFLTLPPHKRISKKEKQWKIILICKHGTYIAFHDKMRVDNMTDKSVWCLTYLFWASYSFIKKKIIVIMELLYAWVLLLKLYYYCHLIHEKSPVMLFRVHFLTSWLFERMKTNLLKMTTCWCDPLGDAMWVHTNSCTFLRSKVLLQQFTSLLCTCEKRSKLHKWCINMPHHLQHLRLPSSLFTEEGGRINRTQHTRIDYYA